MLFSTLRLADASGDDGPENKSSRAHAQCSGGWVYTGMWVGDDMEHGANGKNTTVTFSATYLIQAQEVIVVACVDNGDLYLGRLTRTWLKVVSDASALVQQLDLSIKDIRAQLDLCMVSPLASPNGSGVTVWCSYTHVACSSIHLMSVICF